MSRVDQAPTFWRLIRAELLRLRSRRLFTVMALGAVAIMGLTYTTVVLPALERFEGFARDRGSIPFDPGIQIAISAIRAAFFPPLVALGLLIGASHVGAEWASRGVTNLLFWEPRRVRALAAKFLAVGVVSFFGSLVILALLMIVLSSGPGSGFLDLESLLLFALRAAALVFVTAILGAAIAAVARSTSAALGASFVLLAVAEPLLYANVDNWEQIGVAVSAARVLQWSSLGTETSPEGSVLILLSYAAIFMTIAVGVFRRQEIG